MFVESCLPVGRLAEYLKLVSFDSDAANSGKAVHVHIGNVLIFQKQDAQWKLLARQAYKL